MVDINNPTIRQILVSENGFMDVEIDPTLELFSEIENLH